MKINSSDIYSTRTKHHSLLTCWPCCARTLLSFQDYKLMFVIPFNTLVLLCICVFLQGGGWGGRPVVWLLCRLQEIRLDLTEEAAKEATLSCYIMTRWKRGWLLSATVRYRYSIIAGWEGTCRCATSWRNTSKAVIRKGRYYVQLSKCNKRMPQTI